MTHFPVSFLELVQAELSNEIIQLCSWKVQQAEVVERKVKLISDHFQDTKTDFYMTEKAVCLARFVHHCEESFFFFFLVSLLSAFMFYLFLFLCVYLVVLFLFSQADYLISHFWIALLKEHLKLQVYPLRALALIAFDIKYFTFH